MLGLTSDPQGPARNSPPAKGNARTVLWQPHPRFTMYLARETGSAAGPGTGSDTGLGTPCTSRFTGKLIFDGGSRFRTGGNDRTYTTTEATSSSDIFLYRAYGISGKIVVPSCLIPSRIARAS